MTNEQIAKQTDIQIHLPLTEDERLILSVAIENITNDMNELLAKPYDDLVKKDIQRDIKLLKNIDLKLHLDYYN